MLRHDLFRGKRRVPRFSILLLAIFFNLRSFPQLNAQTAPANLDEQAKALAASGQNFEAAEVLRQALKDHHKKLAEHPDDAASLLAWGACRNALAGQLVNLNQFREAKTLLAETQDRLQAFVAKHPNDTTVQVELAHTLEQLAFRANSMGMNEDAARHTRQATDLLRKLEATTAATPQQRAERARLLTSYAGELMALARYQDATAAYGEALAVGRRLLADHPDLTIAVEGLAVTINAYALLVRETGQFSRAADMIREAIRLLTKLENQYPDQPEHWYALPTFYRNLSQPLAYLSSENEVAMAKREAERLDAKLARFPDAKKKWLADGNKIFNAAANADMARLGGLQGELENNLKTVEANARLHPEVPAYQLQLGAAKLMQGIGLAVAGKPEQDAIRLLREALVPSERLVAEFPDVPKYRAFLAVVCLAVGSADLATGERAEARKQLERAVALCKQTADENPGDPQWRQKLTDATVSVIQNCIMLRDFEDADWLLSVTREEMKKLARAYPSCPRYRRSEAITCNMLALLRRSEGNPDAAEAALREGVALWRQMVVDFPDNPEIRKTLGDALAGLCTVLLERGRYAEVIPAVEEMLRLHEALARDFPKDPEYLSRVASDHACYADTLERQGKTEAGLAHHARCIESLEAAVRLNPRRRDWLGALRAAHLRRADAYLKLGKTSEYQAALTGVKWMEEYLESPLLRLSRINERLAQGNRAAALKEADDLFSNCDLTAAHLDDLTAFYVQAATPGSPEKELCAARAVEALRRACDLGRMSFVALDADPRYRAVADRADFKKLAAEQRK
jgi:tetratricopeptide (TPR) repeat protein